MRARDRLAQNLAEEKRRREQDERRGRDQVIAEFGGDLQTMADEICAFGTVWRSLEGLLTG